jgi:hypothetical protein
MKKAILITASSIAAVGLIGGTVVLKQQLHLSPEFHARLVQLQKSVKAEQDDQKHRMDEHLEAQEIENATIEEHNAQLDVQIAELEGKGTAAARKKLSDAEAKVSGLESSQRMGESLDTMTNMLGHEPPSAAVYAGLPEHANTYRDHLVLKHFKSMEAANTELSACIDKNAKPDNFDTPKECLGFEKQANKDQYYIAAAIDGKY